MLLKNKLVTADRDIAQIEPDLSEDAIEKLIAEINTLTQEQDAKSGVAPDDDQ